MGSAISGESNENISFLDVEASQKKNQTRYYRVPVARAKDRFDNQDQTLAAATYESTIDKFDYLIVFPLAEGPYIPQKPSASSKSDFISWLEIVQIWQQAVPGTDKEKRNAVAAITAIWKKRTGTFPEDSDTIRVSAWLTIAREAIVDQLMNKRGLQVKVTASREFIFCRIRAPLKLLELQADKENYRLQIRGEIDPGSEEFWNKEINGDAVELDEEQRVYSRDEANMILERLYRNNKISPADLGINSEKEVPTTWSRRVHALERIVDRVPVFNKFIPHLQFKSDPHYRYLYQTYPSVRGRTLFRAKDRLFLTKSIIDKSFDCDVLADPSRGVRPVIHAMMCLHDANRGDKTTIDLLQRRWVTFWRASSKEVGSPTVMHDAYESDVELPLYLRPFAQPLSDIREYFGEKIALYYAWFGFYTYVLMFPALLGLAMEILFTIRGYEDTIDHLDYPTYVYFVLVMLWATWYKLSWEVESQGIALKWGTRGFESQEKDRPQFRADSYKPIIRSVVTNHNMTYFPKSKRALRTTGSYIVVIFAVVVDVSLFAAVFVAEYIIIEYYSSYNYSWLNWALSFILAMLIKIGTNLFNPIARALNDGENHRTETEYEDSLVSKVLLFEFFNNFSALFFTAFGKDYILSCESTCIADLRVLLYAIISLRIIFSLWTVAEPLVSQSYRRLFSSENSNTAKKKKNDNLNNNKNKNGNSNNNNGEDEVIDESKAFLNEEPDDNLEFMRELDRDPYNGNFDQYAYAVFQFGYVNLFSIAMPVLGLIALAENMLKIRTDAWKLCEFTRRPHVTLAEDVGKWSFLMDMMCVLGISSSVAIVCFTSPAMEDYSTYLRVISFLGGQQALFMLKFVFHSLFDSEPEWISDIAKRHEFVDDRWIKGYEDDDMDEDAENGEESDKKNLKGIAFDLINNEALNLYDLRKGMKISEKEYAEMESKESKRRELLRELRYAKDKLKDIYKIESYNENTGIGESKHGLPLGRLTAKIFELQDLQGHELESLGPRPWIKVRMMLKGSRHGAPPPLLNTSGDGEDHNTGRGDTRVYQLLEGSTAINQVLGPFGPIRTQDADIVIEVLDMSPNANEASIATTSVKLRELQDQNNHDMVLHMKIRQPSGALRASDARLFVSLKFEYSKVIPLRNRIFEVQDKLRQVERELAALRSGRK